jgi:Zn-dependent protease
MLGWSINLFRIFGIQLAIHGSFVLLLAYYALEGWQQGRWAGMVWRVLLIILFFICVVLHELGHSLTARRFGVKVPRILLMPIGGMAEFDHIPRKPSTELLITIAGPLVNFLIALPLLPYFWQNMVNDVPLTPWSIPELGLELLIANLIMGTFNLLPVFPMDGGRIFRALLATRLPYLRATFWAARIGQILAVILVAITLYNEWWMPAVLFSFIFVVGGAEYKNLLQREQRTAYWAEMAKQVTLSGTSRPSDEPPAPPRFIIHGPN